jgi:hypothetical protein
MGFSIKLGLLSMGYAVNAAWWHGGPYRGGLA